MYVCHCSYNAFPLQILYLKIITYYTQCVIEASIAAQVSVTSLAGSYTWL